MFICLFVSPHLILYASNTPNLGEKIIPGEEMFLIVLMNNTTFNCYLSSPWLWYDFVVNSTDINLLPGSINLWSQSLECALGSHVYEKCLWISLL